MLLLTLFYNPTLFFPPFLLESTAGKTKLALIGKSYSLSLPVHVRLSARGRTTSLPGRLTKSILIDSPFVHF
jgi:hypothetical protein